MTIDLSSLNEPQREAVQTTEGPLLVLAGAGSGKTRVLTYRIAYLLENCGVAPWEVLAITFTNKAANEMRERLGGLLGARSRGMWISTFHSMCVRILRADAERLGFTKNFTIYDTDDEKRLYKEIYRELDIDERRFPVNAVANRISKAKNDLVVPGDFAETATDFLDKTAARVYVRLQERLRAANAFDFDDLLLFAWLLLKNHEDVLSAYQERFRYLLIDEYQDTNHAQYEICRLLAKAHRNIMVVGDDDQSIYSWRGADIRNILEFENDYPEARVVKLEQNYRSVGTILEAANAVIANNEHRKSKRLFTAAEKGDPISLYVATDERDEGRWVAGEIERMHAAGMPYEAFAVFYRTNAQSRVLEDMLLRAGVPYRIVGGTRFFDRAEIRDVMAYLTLVVNPADDIAAHRVINTPKRGIGKATVEHIEEIARKNALSFMEAAELAIVDEDLRAGVRKAIASFLAVIKNGQTYEGELQRVVSAIIDEAGLIEALEAEKTEEARARVENIREFLSVVIEFTQSHDEDEAPFAAPEGDEDYGREPVRVLRGNSLADFIEWVRLRTDLDAIGEDGHAVTLMTIHAAKGLEFDCVFVAGMEESLFPHLTSVADIEGIEEERRLAYVAITRARKKLYLACAQQRQIFGQTSANPASRFIMEIPEELRRTTGVGSAGFSGTGWEKRGSRRGISGSGTEAGAGRALHGKAGRAAYGSGDSAERSFSSASYKKEAASMTFAVGDAVDHKTFGRGVVVDVDGDTLSIHFSKSGQTKRLLKDFAPIVKIAQP